METRGASLYINYQILSILLVSLLTLPQVYLAQDGLTNVADRDERVSVSTDLITVNVSVTDKNGLAVTGLRKTLFNVFDNKNLQELQFFSDEDVPLSVGIVFDTSSSMNGNKIERAKESLSRFIRTSKEEDEFFLIEFNSRTRLLLDRSRDSDALLNKLSNIEPDGNTALYDAVYLGLESVLRGTHSRKIVLVISDGEDNNSRFNFKDLKNRLKENDVIIYAVGFDGYFSSKGRLSGREVLKEMAAISGGKAFFPDGLEETDEAFEQIALELRHLYSISYYPSDFVANGKWHRLKVKVNFPAGSPRFTVRSREGYFALKNQ